jgi:hypothetical protein
MPTIPGVAKMAVTIIWIKFMVERNNIRAATNPIQVRPKVNGGNTNILIVHINKPWLTEAYIIALKVVSMDWQIIANNHTGWIAVDATHPQNMINAIHDAQIENLIGEGKFRCIQLLLQYVNRYRNELSSVVTDMKSQWRNVREGIRPRYLRTRQHFGPNASIITCKGALGGYVCPSLPYHINIFDGSCYIVYSSNELYRLENVATVRWGQWFLSMLPHLRNSDPIVAIRNRLQNNELDKLVSGNRASYIFVKRMQVVQNPLRIQVAHWQNSIHSVMALRRNRRIAYRSSAV